MGSIIVPIFYGEDPEMWIEWIDKFVSAHSFSDFETRQFAYGFIEGEALDWYCDEIARSVFRSWGDLKFRLLQRFRKSVEGAEKLSLQDRLKQLSQDMDRWDEEEEAKRLYKETLAVEDDDQNMTHNNGSGKRIKSISEQTFEEQLPEEDETQKHHENETIAAAEGVELIVIHKSECERRIDLIPELNPLITTPEVKDDESTRRFTIPSLVSETIKEMAIDEKCAEKEASLVSMEDLFMGQKGKVRKKKTRWKKRLVVFQKGFEKELGFDEKGYILVNCEKQLSGFVDSRERAIHHRKRGEETEAESYAYQLLDQLLMRRKKVKKKRWSETERVRLSNMAGGVHRMSDDDEKVSKKGSFTKSMRCIYKAEGVRSNTVGMQKKNKSKNQSKASMESWTRIICQLVNSRSRLNKKWVLGFIKKKKGRMKVEYGKKRSKDFYSLKIDKKQPTRRKKRKLKNKQLQQWKHVKKRPSGKQISPNGNSKLELELVRKYINIWCKRNRCEKSYFKSDKLMQLNEVINGKCKLSLVAKTRRAKLRLKWLAQGKLLAFVAITKYWLKGKMPKIRCKYKNIRTSPKHVSFLVNSIEELMYTKKYSWNWCKRKPWIYQGASLISELIVVTMLWVSVMVVKKHFFLNRTKTKFREKHMKRSKTDYERVCLRGTKSWQPKGLMMHHWKRIGAKSKFKLKVYGNPFSLLIRVWTKVKAKWKDREVKDEYMNKHKANIQGVVNRFTLSKMSYLAKIARRNMLLDNLCIALMQVLENQLIDPASGQIVAQPHDYVAASEEDKYKILVITSQRKVEEQSQGKEMVNVGREYVATGRTVKKHNQPTLALVVLPHLLSMLKEISTEGMKENCPSFEGDDVIPVTVNQLFGRKQQFSAAYMSLLFEQETSSCFRPVTATRVNLTVHELRLIKAERELVVVASTLNLLMEKEVLQAGSNDILNTKVTSKICQVELLEKWKGWMGLITLGSGRAAGNDNFFILTLGTRSILLGAVMIRVLIRPIIRD